MDASSGGLGARILGGDLWRASRAIFSSLSGTQGEPARSDTDLINIVQLYVCMYVCMYVFITTPLSYNFFKCMYVCRSTDYSGAVGPVSAGAG